MIAAPIPANEEQRLRALEELAILGTPAEDRFDRVTRLCQRLFGVPHAFVNLVGRDRLFMKSGPGSEHRQEPRSTSFCGHTILHVDGMVVEDLEGDPRFTDNPLVIGDPRFRFYAGMPLEAPGGERIGTLCLLDHTPRTLTEPDRALLRDLALWVQKELNVEQELDRAAEIQRAMFPARPLDAPGWEVAGACRPSREVGGDFYDWHRSPAGAVVTLGDVMGKGMPAAIVMASVRAALRAGARVADLGAGLRDAALSLADDLEATATFSTAAIARLSPDGGVTLADAGHGHVAIIRADGAVELQTAGGMPLGIDVDERYEGVDLRLEDGDVLVLHSDGLIELPGGPRSTAEVAELLAGSATASEAVDRVWRLCDRHVLSDDVTVVAVLRRP